MSQSQSRNDESTLQQLEPEPSRRRMLGAALGVGAVALSMVPNREAHATVGAGSLLVTDHGAVCDGVTDDAAAINALLASSPAGSIITIPQGANCRVSTTILVPAGKTLQGLSYGTSANTADCVITGDLNVTPVVRIDGGAGSMSGALLSLGVSRASGTIPSGAVGVLVHQCNYSVLQDLYIFQHDIGICIEDSLGINLSRVQTAIIATTHELLLSSVQIQHLSCTYGRNGDVDLPSYNYINISGGNIDTCKWTQCQFNQTRYSTLRAIFFENYSDSNGIFTFQDCHFENWINFLVLDENSTVSRMKFCGCTINSQINQFFIGPPARLVDFSVHQCSITANITLDQQNQVTFVGNNLSGSFLINAGSGIYTGNIFAASNVILEGDGSHIIFTSNSMSSRSGTFAGTPVVANNIPGP